MITLIDMQDNSKIGEITQTQLDYLISQMEEESATDRDYYVSVDTLDYFTREGVDPTLITLLRNALGDRNDMDIRWVIT